MKTATSTRQTLIKILRVVPAVVAVYTAVHTVKMVLERYNGEWYAYLMLGGGVVLEVLLGVGFELLHQNLVHARQRQAVLGMVIFSSLFCTLTVVQQNHGMRMPQSMEDFILHQFLPNAPIAGLWLTIWFFLGDLQARLDGFAEEEKFILATTEFQIKRSRLRDLRGRMLKDKGDEAQRASLSEQATRAIDGKVYAGFVDRFQIDGGTPAPLSKKVPRPAKPEVTKDWKTWQPSAEHEEIPVFPTPSGDGIG